MIPLKSTRAVLYIALVFGFIITLVYGTFALCEGKIDVKDLLALLAVPGGIVGTIVMTLLDDKDDKDKPQVITLPKAANVHLDVNTAPAEAKPIEPEAKLE